MGRFDRQLRRHKRARLDLHHFDLGQVLRLGARPAYAPALTFGDVIAKEDRKLAELMEAIGLNKHADEAFHELNEGQQQLCEKIFKALTDKAGDPRGVRRPTRLAALCALTGTSAGEITDVIDVFREPSRSFLMPSAAESLKPDSVIDISHESLMRIWERLDTWADEEAKSAGTYRRLAETAERFPDGTLVGPELQANLAWRDQHKPNEIWAARYRPGFARAMEFLEKSKFERDAAIEEKKRRDERELRVVRIAALAMGLLAVMAIVLGAAAWRLQRQAEAKDTQARCPIFWPASRVPAGGACTCQSQRGRPTCSQPGREQCREFPGSG